MSTCLFSIQNEAQTLSGLVSNSFIILIIVPGVRKIGRGREEPRENEIHTTSCFHFNGMTSEESWANESKRKDTSYWLNTSCLLAVVKISVKRTEGVQDAVSTPILFVIICIIFLCIALCFYFYVIYKYYFVMSFPRAKIQRFNDVLNNVPSPTKYDPKHGNKIKSGCISKSETKSLNFSDTGSVSSTKSCQTRTPQMPRRHNCLGTSEKETHSAFKSLPIRSEELEILHQDVNSEELKALRVECSNKTETINDLKYTQTVLTQTIFNLETKVSNLNEHIEKIKSEKVELEAVSEEYKTKLEAIKATCKTSNETITGLEMELENRIKELKSLKESYDTAKSEIENLKLIIEKEKLLFEEKLKEYTTAHETNIKQLNDKIEKERNQSSLKIKDSEIKISEIVKNHAKEILQLQNDYESKLLAQMQENTEKINYLQCQLDEKETTFKQDRQKFTRTLAETENKLQEYTNLITQMESENLEKLEEVKEMYSKKIKAIELNSSKTIDMKNKEIDLLMEQYKEILGEVKELLKDLETKDAELKKVSEAHSNLNSRLKIMLEEIIILNKEIEIKSENLEKMRLKYNEEFNKNEQLSCKLGELNCEIIQMKEELSQKEEEFKKVSEEHTKFKHLYEKEQRKNLEAEPVMKELQDKVAELSKKLDDQKTSQEQELKKLNEGLSTLKMTRRNLEIVLENTRKSLEAIRERLIESENEVEKLSGEKNELLEEMEKIKKEKAEIEITSDGYLKKNKELLDAILEKESLCEELTAKLQVFEKRVEDLETEKEKNIQAMNDLVKTHELQLIENEREILDLVEKAIHDCIMKMQFFTNHSLEKVRSLTENLKILREENKVLDENLREKTKEHENLVNDHDILNTILEITTKEFEHLKLVNQESISDLKKKEVLISEIVEEKQKLEEKLNEEKKKKKEVCCEFKHQLNDLGLLNEDDKAAEKKEEVTLEDVKKLIFDVVSKLQKDFATAQEEKLNFVEEIQNLGIEKEELLRKIKIAEEKVETDKKFIDEIHEMKVKAEEASEVQQMKLDKLLEEKTQLESELMALQSENERLQKITSDQKELEERKQYYKMSCMKLDEHCKELEEENATLRKDFNEIHFFLQDRDKTIEGLRKECRELESLIGPFREQLEQYENERMLIETDREQLRKQHLEQAAKLGHQNHRQKIQHVVNLKNTLFDTRKENEKLHLEIKGLKKKVQKLQEQLGEDPKRLFIGGKRPNSTPFKGKENDSFMTTSTPIFTPIVVKQEPMSPGSPLKSRNQ